MMQATAQTFGRLPSISEVAIPFWVGMYLFVFLIPIEFSFYVGSLLITPTRLFLIIMAGPVLVTSFVKHRFQSEDVFFVIFVAWVFLSYLYKHGLGGLEAIGQTFLELVISYCVARSYLTDYTQFRKLALVLSVIVAILGVLAIPEGVLHYRYLHEVPKMLTGFEYKHADDTRVGLLRAASTFEHPILFGLFCASSFAFAWFTFESTWTRGLHLVMTLMATGLALTSAGLLILLLQVMLVIFERVTRGFGKRTLVSAICLGIFIFSIEMTSDRGTVKLIGSWLTFNPETAYYRILQWEHSIDDVMRKPFFGIRLSEWTKPHWMVDSIDNHWLLMALKSGMPSVLAFWIMLVVISVKLYKKKRRVTDAKSQRLYMAWLIFISCMFLGAWTVAFFGKMQPIFLFLIGMGAAMTRLPEQTDDRPLEEDRDPRQVSGSPYTRFAQNPVAGTREAASPYAREL